MLSLATERTTRAQTGRTVQPRKPGTTSHPNRKPARTDPGRNAMRLPLARWQQILLIIVCLGTAGTVVWRSLAPEVPNGHVPVDFPNTWLAPADDGHPERIVIIPGRTEPTPPYEQNGVKLFPAYECLNEKCPGRAGGKPFVYAHWDMRPCPRCGSVDPRQIQRFNTPEGAAMLVEIRKGFNP